jgi:predicted phosphodiesterase
MMQHRHISGLTLLILAVLCSCARSQHIGVLASPYLQAVTTSSVYVLVESSSTDAITVEYGLTKSYGSQARTTSCDTTSDSTFVHNIKLSGLSPNTRYHYRAVKKGWTSDDASFQTAPNGGTSFRFAWMADFRSGVIIHDTIAKRVREANPAVSLYGGDLGINSSYSAFKEQFFRPNELALIREVPFFNTTGNHEKWSQNTRAFTQAPESPSGVQEYYSFDYGDMHVLVLNNEVPYYEGSPQYRFAEHDLPATTKPWKVVIAHRPAYCAGGHGEDSLMKKMSENVFVPNHVDVVFNGHSHFFQHNLVSGIHHMVIGSAGAPLYEPGTAPYVIKGAKEHNYGIIDVSPSSFMLIVYNDKGMPLDTLSLKKNY